MLQVGKYEYCLLWWSCMNEWTVSKWIQWVSEMMNTNLLILHENEWYFMYWYYHYLALRQVLHKINAFVYKYINCEMWGFCCKTVHFIVCLCFSEFQTFFHLLSQRTHSSSSDLIHSFIVKPGLISPIKPIICHLSPVSPPPGEQPLLLSHANLSDNSC